MAASMDFTYDWGTMANGQRGSVFKVIADWVSASDGTASATTSKLSGRLVKAVTDPSGSAAPTDDYDVVITDEEGMNVLAFGATNLTNRDTANSEAILVYSLGTYTIAEDTASYTIRVGAPVCDKLTISVTNAGDSKAGQVILYFEV